MEEILTRGTRVKHKVLPWTGMVAKDQYPGAVKVKCRSDKECEPYYREDPEWEIAQLEVQQ